MLFHGDGFHIQMHFSQILSGLCLNSNVFFSPPQMHSKCSFMATASTFKCIFLRKNSPVYALTQMCFFTSGNTFKCSFMAIASTFKCIFSNIVGFMPRRNPFFTSRNAFQMLFHGGCFTFKCIFLKYCPVLPQLKCIFFISANAFQMLIHGDCFHIQMSYCRNVRLPHTRTRASARTRARTEQMSQRTPCKHFFLTWTFEIFLRTFENF